MFGATNTYYSIELMVKVLRADLIAKSRIKLHWFVHIRYVPTDVHAREVFHFKSCK